MATVMNQILVTKRKKSIMKLQLLLSQKMKPMCQSLPLENPTITKIMEEINSMLITKG